MTTVDPDHPDHRVMSRHLWDILDDIGLSPDVREMTVKTAITAEIRDTLVSQFGDRKVSAYIFGSSCEGTTTHGLQSDADVLYHIDIVHVVDHLDDAPRDGVCALLVTDSNTRPGYAKLQLVFNGIPVTDDKSGDLGRQLSDGYSVDRDGRMVMNQTMVHSLEVGEERHGPASTRIAGLGTVSKDNVPAYRCRSWPRCATEYLNRARHYEWPTHDQLEKMGRMGCFLVPVGHPDSPEQPLEWRISFSLQERELMLSLNAVQYKCYVLLKLVKKDIITEQFGDSISSYHCKTCLLYAIETMPSGFWVPDNLVECLLHCLNVMYRWAVDGVCPNYFIPDENMFDRRIHGELREKLSTLLQDLLTENGMFLFRIRCDVVGGHLAASCCGNSLPENLKEERSRIKFTRYRQFGYRPIASVNSLINAVTASDSTISCIQDHEKMFALLDHTTTVRDHTECQTRAAIQLLLPFLHTSMASHLAARLIGLQLTNRHADEVENIRLAMDEHVVKGLRSEIQIPSCRLKVAAIHYMLGEYDTIEHILSEVTSAFHPVLNLNVCTCKPEHVVYDALLMDKLSRENLSVADVLQTYASYCVHFLPTEIDVTPAAMQYEMFKSVGTPPEPKHEDEDWYDWGVVDGIVFLHYMNYLVYDKTGDIRQRRLAVENLETLTTTDVTLRHRETAYNLLGWIYKQEGDVNMAEMCFTESLRLEPIHNAAKRHIGELNAAKRHIGELKLRRTNRSCCVLL